MTNSNATSATPGREPTPVEDAATLGMWLAIEEALAYARRHSLYPEHGTLQAAERALAVLRSREAAPIPDYAAMRSEMALNPDHGDRSLMRCACDDCLCAALSAPPSVGTRCARCNHDERAHAAWEDGCTGFVPTTQEASND